MSTSSRSIHLAWILTIVLACVAGYSNAIDNGYVIDDETIVRNNPDAASVRRIGHIFTSDYWYPGHSSDSVESIRNQFERYEVNTLYRPVTIFSFAATASLVGHNPRAHHAINLGLHALISVLAFLTLALWTRSKTTGGIGGVLFAVHPLHSEVVGMLIGRGELLATIGVLGSLLALGKFHQTGKRAWQWAAWTSWLFGLLAKESAVLLVPLVILLVWTFGVETPLPFFSRSRFLEVWRRWWRTAIGFGLPLSILIGLRWYALGTPLSSYFSPRQHTKQLISFVLNPIFSLPFSDRWLTGTALIGKYVGLHLWPHPLSFDYSYNVIPKVAGIADPRFLLGAVAVLGLAATMVLVRNRFPVVTVGLGFWLWGLVQYSNIFIPFGTIFAERLMYLPSLGFCLALGCVGERAWSGTVDRGRVRAVLVGCAVSLLILCIVTCHRRNPDFHDNLTLATAAVETASGESCWAWFVIGQEHAKQGRYAEAVSAFEQSARIYPQDMVFDTIAIYQANLGRWDKAVEASRRAVALFGDYWPYRKRLAVALVQTGDIDGAINEFETALAAAPRDALMHLSVGNLLKRKGDLPAAERHFRAALAGDNPPPACLLALGDVLAAQNRSQAARDAYQAYLAQPLSPEEKAAVEQKLRALSK